MTQPFDTNNKTRYTVWMCYADKPDEVYASDLSEWDADMIVNEMNSLDDSADYRYCEATEEDIANELAKEYFDNLYRFQTGTF